LWEAGCSPATLVENPRWPRSRGGQRCHATEEHEVIPQTLGPKRCVIEELRDQTPLDQHLAVGPNLETPSCHNAGRGTPTR